MTLIQMSQCRLERSAQTVCNNRNQNVAVEFGKSLFEMKPNCVVFSKASYLLDSTNPDYILPVAKVEFDDQLKQWRLSIYQENSASLWDAYPPLPTSTDLAQIMKMIEEDPSDDFW
ncbi:DUF3024 domain-containing protein [Vibrio hippocampi]|uniref:DUF3024 domain-containing protein n=1 Tax=Vibrio hippocampi TaxID=654686 RepID=A0ABM8ZN70_9VIBR|nr:DUF3024 domain-containing protein [Vibrio hippocampi]CAH0530035.1 hypothetical protein VHP8226_03762 [Vibrio hippocampi]